MPTQNIQQPPNQPKMPPVPRAFINHPKIKYVLYHTINEFDFEEQAAIYYYCFIGLSVSKIAALTELTPNHVASTLNLYSEKLLLRLDIFKKAIPYDTDDLLPVSELLSLQL